MEDLNANIPEEFSFNNNLNDFNCSSIKGFFKNAQIFITGGTGFLGKTLIEKLLRSCDEIKTIYILVRPKRGVASEQRYKDFVKNPIFDRIRTKTPEALEKLICIPGDLNHAYIGLDEIDRIKLANNVNIVFHSAATVRFNENLNTAGNLNTLGTQRIMEFCSTCKNLQSVVHVSTAYSNPMHTNISEAVYPTTPIDKDTFINCINAFTKDSINLISDRLQGSHPNSYTLTKSMAESVLTAYNHKIPLCIVRPSIVTAASDEPYPGWIDSVTGITGIIVEILKGTAKTLICEKKCLIDIIPVDYVVNTLITAAWANTFMQSNKVQVYNCTSGQMNPIRLQEFGKIIEKYAIKNPTKFVLFYPGFTFRTNYFAHRIYEFFFHFFPSIIFDLILKVKKSKPIMLQMAKRFKKSAKVGEYFVLHEWIFENENLKKLIRATKMTKDGDEFNLDIRNIDWDSYVEKYMLGIRKYLLNDDIESLEFARKKLNR